MLKPNQPRCGSAEWGNTITIGTPKVLKCFSKEGYLMSLPSQEKALHICSKAFGSSSVHVCFNLHIVLWSVVCSSRKGFGLPAPNLLIHFLVVPETQECRSPVVSRLTPLCVPKHTWRMKSLCSSKEQTAGDTSLGLLSYFQNLLPQMKALPALMPFKGRGAASSYWR